MRCAIRRCFMRQIRGAWNQWCGWIASVRKRCATEAQLWQQRWLCAQKDLVDLERQELEAKIQVHTLNKSLRKARLQAQLPMLRLLVLEWEYDYLRIALAVWSSVVSGARSSALLLQLQQTRRVMEEALLATLTPDAAQCFHEWKLVCDVENTTLYDAKQHASANTKLSHGLTQRCLIHHCYRVLSMK